MQTIVLKEVKRFIDLVRPNEYGQLVADEANMKFFSNDIKTIASGSINWSYKTAEDRLEITADEIMYPLELLRYGIIDEAESEVQ